MLNLSTLLLAAEHDTRLLTDMPGMIASAESVCILMAFANEWLDGAFSSEADGSLFQGHVPGRFVDVCREVSELLTGDASYFTTWRQLAIINDPYWSCGILHFLAQCVLQVMLQFVFQLPILVTRT
jgi:hypothetical protein